MHLFMAAEFTNVCEEFCFELVTTETKCNENPWIANHEFHYHEVLKQYSLSKWRHLCKLNVYWIISLTRIFLRIKSIVTWSVIYHKIASFNMSRLEAPTGFFRLVMNGILMYLVTFWQKVDFLISLRVSTRDSTVCMNLEMKTSLGDTVDSIWIAIYCQWLRLTDRQQSIL